jgi:hypothetical protein
MVRSQETRVLAELVVLPITLTSSAAAKYVDQFCCYKSVDFLLESVYQVNSPCSVSISANAVHLARSIQ